MINLTKIILFGLFCLFAKLLRSGIQYRLLGKRASLFSGRPNINQNDRRIQPRIDIVFDLDNTLIESTYADQLEGELGFYAGGLLSKINKNSSITKNESVGIPRKESETYFRPNFLRFTIKKEKTKRGSLKRPNNELVGSDFNEGKIRNFISIMRPGVEDTLKKLSNLENVHFHIFTASKKEYADQIIDNLILPSVCDGVHFETRSYRTDLKIVKFSDGGMDATTIIKKKDLSSVREKIMANSFKLDLFDSPEILPQIGSMILIDDNDGYASPGQNLLPIEPFLKLKQGDVGQSFEFTKLEEKKERSVMDKLYKDALIAIRTIRESVRVKREQKRFLRR